MPPKSKRPAEPTWAQGDRVRAATDALVAPMIVIPVLPADCWGIVMEFVLGRRTMATFGANGCINESFEYLPKRDSAATTQLHALRCVSRIWCRLASALVQSIRYIGVLHPNTKPSFDLAAVFPNVRCIRVFSGTADFIAPMVKTLEENAERRHGCPPPIGYSRICMMNACSPNSTARVIGENDTIFQHAVNPQELVGAMTNADVVYISGPYYYDSAQRTEKITFPLHVRAKIILFMSTSRILIDFLFCLLAGLDAAILKTICIYTPRLDTSPDFYVHCQYLGIQCLSQPNATTEEIEYTKRQISAIHNVFW